MSTPEQKSLFSRQVSPIHQALMAFGGVLLFSMLSSFFSMSSDKLTLLFPWVIAVSFTLFFTIFNSVFWISAKDNSQYISQSIMSYVGLATVSGLLAYAISGLKPSEAGSIKAIFIILTFGYLVFLAITGTIKRLIVFLNTEEKNKLEGKGRKKGRRRRRRKF